MNNIIELGLLLDTNIVTYTSSETSWKKLYEPILRDETLYISFMTLAELLEASHRRGLSSQRILLHKKEIHSRYSVIPFTEEICDCFGRVRAARKNRPISVPDALIAATALTYGLPLVTHNRKDFEDIEGLNIISEYKAQ